MNIKEYHELVTYTQLVTLLLLLGIPTCEDFNPAPNDDRAHLC